MCLFQADGYDKPAAEEKKADTKDAKLEITGGKISKGREHLLARMLDQHGHGSHATEEVQKFQSCLTGSSWRGSRYGM